MQAEGTPSPQLSWAEEQSRQSGGPRQLKSAEQTELRDRMPETEENPLEYSVES